MFMRSRARAKVGVQDSGGTPIGREGGREARREGVMESGAGSRTLQLGLGASGLIVGGG